MAKNNFDGELLHFHVVRSRVTGVGSLRLFLRSLDDVHNVQLTSIPMVPLTNREPTVLANFIDQRGQLEVRTTVFEEYFVVSKLIIYVKPMATGYPQ